MLMIACAQSSSPEDPAQALREQAAREACEARDDCFGPPSERTAEANSLVPSRDTLAIFFWLLIFAGGVGVLVLWLIVRVRGSGPAAAPSGGDRAVVVAASPPHSINRIQSAPQPGVGGLVAYDLERLTGHYTKMVVVRQYDSDDKGIERYENEAGILLRNGYQIEGQDTQGSHIHAGRLILTGGWSVLAGRRGIRSKGKVTVTFLKVA